ncbi:C40 family peptidase [Ideonella sp.]|uniref:C40 family peptidase n=1 Tax=Ideonella sp. TaxID=1929293 RepID=UPI0035B392EC
MPILRPLKPALVAALLALTLSAAQAAPGAPAGAAHDPVMQLLQDRGLIQPGTAVPPASGAPTGLIHQVREKASDLVLSAMNFIGVRYRRGGTSAENGFDCSGFTRYVFENSVGLVLPRRADEQAKAPGLFSISKDDLKPGDLVFFNTLRRTFSHVGIYIGDGKFIHSPRAGGEVRIEDMRMEYWAKRFNGARRAPEVGGTVSAEAGNRSVQ